MRTMRSVLFGILGFVVGLVATVVLVFGGYIAFTVVTDYHDFEGATAMGMASMLFFLAPVGGIVCGFLFAYRFGRVRTI